MANDEYPLSEFEKHAEDNDWFDEGEEVYEELLDELIEDFGSDVIDERASDLLWGAFFDPEMDPIDRAYMRFEFFEYTGLTPDDFDWDAWREWYES